LRNITSSSDLLAPEILKQAFGANPALRIFNIYGLTEAGRACFREITASSESCNSIGRPSPGVTITIDPQSDDAGEIVIKGPNVMCGYFERLDGEHVVFTACDEMRTGDLGRYNAEGELVLLGRRDHMLNIKGMKIHPAEIEQIALQAPGVIDARARRVDNSNAEPLIHLEIVTNGSQDARPVADHLRRNLPPAFLPSEIIVVPKLKRTELGSKIIRQVEPV
jgi:acyl-CoA synthetase (AMP-forming)/AMP-acid ligase II